MFLIYKINKGYRGKNPWLQVIGLFHNLDIGFKVCEAMLLLGYEIEEEY